MTDVKPYQEELYACKYAAQSDELQQGCSICAPKLALTAEEESILGQMRALKRQVRPIKERLKAIEQGAQGTSQDAFVVQGETESAQLNDKLSRLRNEWKECEVQLSRAIERKLILLGHRKSH